MKKYRGILLSVSIAAMLMGSCAAVYAEETESATEVVAEVAAPAVEVGEDGLIESDRQALESYSQTVIETIVTASDADLNDIINPSSIINRPQEFLTTGAASWMEVKEDLGAYTGIESFKIDTDDEIVVDALCNFENGQNTVTITIDKANLTPESVQFETANASMGQKMKEAVLNTLMGVSIVFLMLLFLSALISQFKNINKIEQAMKKKNAPAPAPAPKAAAPVAAPVEEEVMDDGELIAVIAAAIAAAEGTSTDGFVVRSIKKSNRNKWQRA